MEPKDVRALFPGTPIELVPGKVSAMVYPAGIGHIRDFASEVVVLLSSARDLLRLDGETAQEQGARILSLVGPTGSTALINFMGACIVFDPPEVKLEDIPHYLVPPLLAAWIEENVAEGKWKSWGAMIEQVAMEIWGKKISISELLSSFASPSDTSEQTSSSINSPTSPTEVGASLS